MAGHEIAVRSTPRSSLTLVTVSASAAPVAMLKVLIVPVGSTPTQRSLLGHDRPDIVEPPMVKVHAAEPPAGSADTSNSPSVALIRRAAMQKAVPRHVTAV